MNLIANKEAYQKATPFPHCIIDDVFDPMELRLMLCTWPEKHEHFTRNNLEVSKAHSTSEEAAGPIISNFVKINFQSQRFMKFLEELTGITGLLFDHRKWALHETFSGGSLAPHLDYTINKATGLQLRVNVLLYLNENWKPEYNGNLELYESHPGYGGRLSRSVVSVAPIFNRLVIFTMDADNPAWHGHPLPLNTGGGYKPAVNSLELFHHAGGRGRRQSNPVQKAVCS